MKFKNGDRVKGLMYEFKDKIGTVYEQVNKGVILVDLSKSCKKSMLVRKFISIKLAIIDYYYEWRGLI